MHQHHVPAAEHTQHLGEFPGDVGMSNPYQLVTRARRIGERTKDVEHRPDPDFLPGGADESHRGMERGREHEPDADFIDRPRDFIAGQLHAYAQPFQQVG